MWFAELKQFQHLSTIFKCNETDSVQSKRLNFHPSVSVSEYYRTANDDHDDSESTSSMQLTSYHFKKLTVKDEKLKREKL